MALGSDGNIATHEKTRVGKQSTQEEAARQIVKHAARRDDMVVFTGMGELGYFVSKLAPKLWERIMTDQFKQELY